MTKVFTSEELGEALKNKEDTIEIEGDLAKKTIRIRATGKIAWAIALTAIGVSVYAAIATIPTGGSSSLGFVAAPAAIAILGSAATFTAIAIAVTAGGVGALTSLRSYKEISRTANTLALQRK